jgi:type I restriction enzyme M protein
MFNKKLFNNMTKTYKCDFCQKVFQQKIDYDRHISKKNACVKLDQLKNIINPSDEQKHSPNNLTTIFKYCLDVLRDNEHLTGDKALRNLSHFLDLKLLEKRFGSNSDQINIDDFKYNFDDVEDNQVEEFREQLLKYVRFSNLSPVNENGIVSRMKYIWDYILSVHPSTCNIFLRGRGFEIQNQSTFKKIIDKLNSFNFDDIEDDILGEIYEEVIKDIMIGKTLGQYFTPTHVKKLMVQLVNPQLFQDGTMETIFDPAMGTGGFLITALRHIIKQSQNFENSENKINIDWNFASNNGLGGREAEPDTFQLAVSNMLISSGHMFNVLEQGDSIRSPITNKYDIILANPPFGIKGLTYDDIRFNHSNLDKDKYLPIKSDSAVPLFLQVIIWSLKINGRCAVVLPNGKELYNDSYELLSIRQFLMKTCELVEVIYLPAKTFTHTSIKTCILYFYKREEGQNVMKPQITYNSKNKNKEVKREYIFKSEHKTKKVKFTEYNQKTNERKELLEVDIENIEKHNYSLNYTDYLESEEVKYNEEVEIRTLGEVCELEIGGTPSRKENEYYENGTNLWVSVRELNGGYIYDTTEKLTDLGVEKSSVKLYKKDTVLFSFKLSIGKTAMVGNPLYSNEAIAGLFTKNTNYLINKYLYYYLTMNDFTHLGSGCISNGSLNKKSLAVIKIPIPSIEKQREMVEYLDFIYEKCNKTSNEKIDELNKMNEYCIKNNKRFGKNEVMTLGEVCEILPKSKRQASYGQETGKYPFFKSSLKVNSFVDKADYNEESIIIGDGGEPNINYGINFSTSDHCYVMIKKMDVNLKYIYYYLYNNLNIMELYYKGVGIKNISKTNIQSIKIPIPSIEKQREMVEYCENNDRLIKQLEQEIETNKRNAELYINNILNFNNDEQNIQPFKPSTPINILNSMINTEQNIQPFKPSTPINILNSMTNVETTQQPSILIPPRTPRLVIQQTLSPTLTPPRTPRLFIQPMTPSLTNKNINGMNVKELNAECKARGIKNYSKLKKDELLKLLNK